MSSSLLGDFILGESLLGEGAIPPDLPEPPPPSPGVLLTKSRRREGLPTVNWTIDGVLVPMVDWQANGMANGGFDRMTGRIPEAFVWQNPTRILQEAPIVATVTSEQYVWYGHLVGEPILAGGLVEIEATGYKDRVVEAAGRLLYQSRDYSLFAEGSDSPYEFSPSDDKIEADLRDGSLRWKVTTENHDAGDYRPIAAWFVGAPSGITRYAFTISKSDNDSKYDVRTQSFTGPSGTRTVIADHGLGGAQPTEIDETISLELEDGFVIGVRCGIDDGPPPRSEPLRVKVVNLRLNGIAPGDEFLTSEVVADIGTRVGYDTSMVTAGGANAMPFDLSDGSWSQALDYLAGLDDWAWGVFEDVGRGPMLHYGPWEARTWHVARSQNAATSLRPLPIYNRVVVRYTAANGGPQQVEAVASPDPLFATFGDRVWFEDLADPQPNNDLATLVAETLIARVSVPRYAGTIEIVDARLDSGIGNAYAVRPGDMVNVADWAPGTNLRQRIREVEYTADRVRLGIEAAITAEGLQTMYDLEQLRRRKGK